MRLDTNSQNFPNKFMLYKSCMRKLRTTQDPEVEWWVCGKHEKTFLIKDVLDLIDARAGNWLRKGRVTWIEFDYSQLTDHLNSKIFKLKETYSKTELSLIKRLISDGLINP